MAVVLDIELLTGRYDAAGAGDRDHAEWPPHPARVFCALVAGARTEQDRQVLRWLEALPHPMVQAAPGARDQAHASYVVTNAVKSGGGSQFHPGRTNALKVRHSALPPSSCVHLIWPEVEPEPAQVAALDALARRVPYLGRSTGVAALSVTAGREPAPCAAVEGHAQFHPAAEGGRGVDLRVPYPGYLDLLSEQYDLGRPAWEVSHAVTYLADEAPQSSAAPIPVPSVYTDVIILCFNGLRPEGRLTTLFTEALRRKVMAATADPLPAALHGHGADGRPHVAFLALPNADNPRADGRLLGMAVAIPDLPTTERRTIVRGVLAGGEPDVPGRPSQRTMQLNVPRIGAVDLSHHPGLVRPWALRPERWRRGSDHWVTVTPVVLDRYPKAAALRDELVRSCLRVGLPAPRDVTVSAEPLVTGGVRMRPSDLPQQTRGRLFRHVELHFDRPVAGPVLLGAGRYLGVGLFAPIRQTHAVTEAQS